MPDVLELIKLQHRQLDDLLEQAQQAEGERVTALLQQAADLLIPHSQAEESFIYPAIQEYDRDEAEDAHDAVAEHHHVEELMKQLLSEESSAPGFDGKLAAMIAEIRHHVEEEESELLPVLAERASAEERDELGVRFAEVTGQELAAEAPAGEPAQQPSGKSAQKSAQKTAQKSSGKSAEKTVQRSGTSSAKDLAEGHSKEELYRLAKEKDIPGRSSMSKDELAKALDKQG